MFGSLMLSVIAILAVGILVLVGVCVHHYFYDPFDMSEDMKELKESLRKDSKLINIFKDIRSKMENCPIISNNIPTIEVYNNCNNFYVLIVGDDNGKPRLFAYRRSEYVYLHDYIEMRDKSPRFKKQGLRHSISMEELNLILCEAEKNIFVKELEEEQKHTIQRHFK